MRQMKELVLGAGTVGLSLAAKQAGARGRTTGIGFINRAVVQKDREHGIATPCNAMMVDHIWFRESPLGGDRP
jgi:ketopantoate reductase